MSTSATNKQIPDAAIMDHYNKQAYLGNRYNYILSYTAAGTGEVAQILLQNLAVVGSAFPAQNGAWKALFVDLRSITGLTASDVYTMKTYLNPTVSSVGTAQTPVNLRPASTNTSIATVHSAPSVSANGTLVETLASPALGTQMASNLIILDPGQSLLITLQTAISGVINAQIGWYEL